MNDFFKKSVNNDRGSAIVLAMMILVVVTILGISAINDSVVELRIVQNEKKYQENFYQAESAAMEGAQKLENSEEDDLDDRTFTAEVWLKGDSTNDVMRDPNNWTATNSSGATGMTNTDLSVVEVKIAHGASLDMTDSMNLFEYAVRGLSRNNGEVLIEIGYKKRH